MEEAEGECPIIRAWMSMPAVVSRAGATFQITVLEKKKEMDRSTVANNADILEPVIETYGN